MYLQCCGCFGPVGGKKNITVGHYCTAKNGGTIVKNVYTWFWVRPSLPKRVWNKCMEYKVTVAPGKEVWYKYIVEIKFQSWLVFNIILLFSTNSWVSLYHYAVNLSGGRPRLF